ncbi:hypothetical protein JHK84_032913 [Glycine max]|nr:hypothetical protein JHK84_032913 [Glycine max]
MAATNNIHGNTESAQSNIAPPTKQPLHPSKTVDSQSVLKRLQSELMALMMSGDSGISAFPEEDNIFFWKGTITGSKDTVFEGTEYKLSLSFPNDYPFKPPKVKFETTCFHPNFDVHGNICLDILQVFDVTICRSNINCVLPLPLYILKFLFIFLWFYRINGHLLMMSEQFFYLSKVCLESQTLVHH